ACVRHAASVRPEPGSNSQMKLARSFSHEFPYAVFFFQGTAAIMGDGEKYTMHRQLAQAFEKPVLRKMPFFWYSSMVHRSLGR
ncbi:MAG TPA: hypothetical protein PL052_06120, partial [Synergistales bacterium]|nr:hypothetical protein [Synergistales bacterium]HPC75801.1 hypothetical protein [Synergistales bacterium]HRS48554.1 hypothetical protein [Thermovirgaceae bacterium]HRU90683.1 hypothetical protein [Thermovirgaceae bacterium]